MSETVNQYQRITSAPEESDLRVNSQNQQPTHGQQSAPESGKEKRKKYKKVLFSLGLTEVVLGSLAIFFHTIAIIIAVNNRSHICDYCYDGRSDYHHGFTYAGQGIWCGFFLIVSGVLGIKTTSNQSVPMYSANMAMSIISACMMVPLMILSSLAAFLETDHNPQFILTSLVGLNSVVVVIAFAAAIVCIVHSAYCCAGVCNNRRQYTTTVAYAAPHMGQQQVFMLPNGQYVMAPANPIQGYPAPNIPVAATQVAYQPPLGGTVIPPQQIQSVPAVTGPQFQAAPMVVGGQVMNQPFQRVTIAPQPMAYQPSVQPQQIQTVPPQVPRVTPNIQSTVDAGIGPQGNTV